MKLENVKVQAYGNAWGANPCPSRPPFNGHNCTNIMLYGAEDVSMDNIYLEDGSSAVKCVDCLRIQVRNIFAKNVRGPSPSGVTLGM